MPISHDVTLCPMDTILRLLMARWAVYILWYLNTNGPQRFGELRKGVPGISAKMLAERLRELEGAGVLSRTVSPTVPPQVTYAMTERGAELDLALQGLHRVALDWQRLGWSAATGFPPAVAA